MTQPILPNDKAFLDAIAQHDQQFAAWLQDLAKYLPIDWLAPELEVMPNVLYEAKRQLGTHYRKSPHPDYCRQNTKFQDATPAQRQDLMAKALFQYGRNRTAMATSLGLRMRELKVWFEGPQGQKFKKDNSRRYGQQYYLGANLAYERSKNQESKEAAKAAMLERHAQWRAELRDHDSDLSYARAAGISPTAARARRIAVGRPPNREKLDAHIIRLQAIKKLIDNYHPDRWNHARTRWWAWEAMSTNEPTRHQRLALARALREVGLVCYRVPGNTEGHWCRIDEVPENGKLTSNM